MDELLFLKIIDWTKLYGLQIIGVIIVILLSKYYMPILLWIVSFIIGLIFFVIQLVFLAVRLFLRILPAKLQYRMNNAIHKIESFIRGIEDKNNEIKNWFEATPGRYQNVYKRIKKVIQSAFVLYLVGSTIILVINVFIQKSLTFDQIVAYF